MDRVLFSFEVPINHLEDFEPYQDFHFAIALQLQSCPTLRNHVSKYDKPLWLDNGANEAGLPLSTYELQEVMHETPADFVILPDFHDAYFYQGREKLAIEIMLMYAERYRYSLMAGARPVPVCYTVDMVKRCYDLGYRVVALPYKVNRLAILEQITGMENLHIHLLGYRAAEELQHPLVDSVDTAFPIKLAMKGVVWTPCMRDAAESRTSCEYFRLRLSEDVVKRAIEGIEEMKSYARR